MIGPWKKSNSSRNASGTIGTGRGRKDPALVRRGNVWMFSVTITFRPSDAKVSRGRVPSMT